MGLDSQRPNLLSSLQLSFPLRHPLSPPLGLPRTLAPLLGILPEAEEAPVEVGQAAAGHDQHLNLVDLELVDPQHRCPANLRQHKQDAPPAPAPLGSPTFQREEVEAHHANR